MTTALAHREPYRVSAGVLALLVHLAFFALLYFGVRWQSRPPEEFAVEMWEALPNAEIVPEQVPAPPVVAEPVQPPRAAAPALPPAKAEIELREKKKKKAEQKQQTKKEVAKEKAAARAQREKDRRELDEYVARRVEAEQARVRAEVDAATKVQVERYQDKIISKIRSRRREVADVPKDAEVIFKVTLLPDGSLMDEPVLIKSSGFPAYDQAAERAILAAQPLPMPPDVSLQRMFRELRLSIKP